MTPKFNLFSEAKEEDDDAPVVRYRPKATITPPRARRTDPDTSKEAAARVRHKLRPIQQQVLDTLIAAGPSGLTDLDLENICGSHGSTYRTRRSELVDMGYVVDSGHRLQQKGSNRIVWIAVQFSPPKPEGPPC